jgi:glutamate 5-kinase
LPKDYIKLCCGKEAGMNKGIIVVKVGTAVLSKRISGKTPKSGKPDPVFIKDLARQVCRLKKTGLKVILVSSGAIGAGIEAIGLKERPSDLSRLQACAAIGQGKIMKLYEESFSFYGKHAAQILLTREDFSSKKRILTARQTINSLLNDFNAVPVINENDTIATEEIKFGDNDMLSALVAKFMQADMLVMLTDVEALYDPKSKKSVGVVEKINKNIENMAQPRPGFLGRGGMASKIQAAKITTSAGIKAVIANGRLENALVKIIENRPVGTMFLPAKKRK